jgi:hypothetical protein
MGARWDSNIEQRCILYNTTLYSSFSMSNGAMEENNNDGKGEEAKFKIAKHI